MRILSWDDFASGALKAIPIAATIGVFDGLHIGHRQLISRVLGQNGLSSVVFTFKVNPKRLHSPDSFAGELSTLTQKLDLLASMSMDIAVLIDFSGDFSKLPGRQFLAMLRDGSELHRVAVGAGFRCGYRLDTDAEGIRSFCLECGADMEAIPAVSWAGHPVSSSRIRKAVRDGRLEDVSAMLGRPYELDLRGREATESGRWSFGCEQALPPAGRYEVSLAYAGALSVPAIAEHDGKGNWSLDGALRTPDALGLIRSVSRE
jgi:riboflavin kinase/FMN adenylyltransferase